MKNLFLIISVLILSVSVNAQALRYGQIKDPKMLQNYYKAYKSFDSTVYQIGDTIKIGFPSSNNTFSYVSEGDGLLIPHTNAPATIAGNDAIIKRIFVNGNSRSGYQVNFKVSARLGVISCFVQIENALSTGEIKRAKPTSDEALDEIKKAKTKLELELITQEEYNAIKSDMIKYIK
jgi:hypothetical protein